MGGELLLCKNFEFLIECFVCLMMYVGCLFDLMLMINGLLFVCKVCVLKDVGFMCVMVSFDVFDDMLFKCMNDVEFVSVDVFDGIFVV